MKDQPDLILHHYDFSNYSEKIRLVLGLKNLAWSSVEVPAIAPKPDYTPLTGGYRRAPALQIGADIYCDTALIADHLEHLAGEPTLYPGDDYARSRAFSRMLTSWAESNLLRPLALFITGLHADTFDADFHADRAVLHGKPQPELAQVKAAAEKYRAQVDGQLAWIEDLLAPDHRFICGQEISLADISLYQAPWFLRTIGGEDAVPAELVKLKAWAAAVHDTGHGQRQAMAPAQALALAKAAEPRALGSVQCRLPAGIALGDQVSVSPFDQFAPATGKLIAIDAERISIMTENENCGRLHVHFPRLGYRIKRLQA